MRTVPLEYGEYCRPLFAGYRPVPGEVAKPYGWKQFIVLHPTKQPAILCLHSRLKVRFKSWKVDGDLALIHEAKAARAERTWGGNDYSFALSGDFA